jgi:GT2 family glycosyltransferase
MIDKSAVFSVIITYGKRFYLLKQVVNACINEGIGKIIVVDNCSENREELQNLEKILSGKLRVIYLDRNTGSAGGFKVGLEEACKEEKCQQILLLDDDNIPAQGSIQRALLLWNYFKTSEEFFALSFLRKTWVNHLWAIKLGLTMKFSTDSFVGFGIKDVLLRLILVYKYTRKVMKKRETLYPIALAEASPYGGLFFNKTILQKIGFPDEKFILYADDTEFTYRITEKGGKIYLCSNLEIEDIDWPSERTRRNGIHYFYQDNANEAKIYYFTRNWVFLERKFVRTRLIYNVNLIARLTYNFGFLYLRNVHKIRFKLYKRRVKLIWKAICDGQAGNLGKGVFENQELKP